MVGNPETATLIAWSEEGRSFWIHDPDALEAMVLPRVFNHGARIIMGTRVCNSKLAILQNIACSLNPCMSEI